MKKIFEHTNIATDYTLYACVGDKSVCIEIESDIRDGGGVVRLDVPLSPTQVRTLRAALGKWLEEQDP